MMDAGDLLLPQFISSPCFPSGSLINKKSLPVSPIGFGMPEEIPRFFHAAGVMGISL